MAGQYEDLVVRILRGELIHATSQSNLYFLQ